MKNPVLHMDYASLVDEVRAIRRGIYEKNGNNLDLLYAELLRTEEEFRSKSGDFSSLRSAPSADDVVKKWSSKSEIMGSDILTQRKRPAIR